MPGILRAGDLSVLRVRSGHIPQEAEGTHFPDSQELSGIPKEEGWDAGRALPWGLLLSWFGPRIPDLSRGTRKSRVKGSIVVPRVVSTPLN